MSTPPISIYHKIVDGSTPIRRENLSMISATLTDDKNSPLRRESLSYTNINLHENRKIAQEANDALLKHDAALILQLQNENNLLKQQRMRDKTVISEYVTRTHNLSEEILVKETFLDANKNLLQSIYKQLNILADLAKTKEIDHFRDHLTAVINTLSCHDTAIDILNISKNENKKSSDSIDIDIEDKQHLDETKDNKNGLYNIKTIREKVTKMNNRFNVENDQTENDETNNNEVDIEAILADEILQLMRENKHLKQNSLKLEKHAQKTTSTAIDLSLKEAEENSRLSLELLASNQEILKLREKVKLSSWTLEEFRHREIELLQALEGVIIRFHEIECNVDSNVWLDAYEMKNNKKRSPVRPFKI